MEFEGVPFGSLFGCSQRNGLTRPKKVRGSGLPMVNMGELFAHPRINHVEMDLVPVSESESDFLLEPGDLLFARQSLVRAGAGQCSLFVGNSLPTVFESHLIRCRLDTRRTVPDFYFYFFRSPQGRVAMDAIIEQGAGAAGIRGSDLVRIEVPAPRLAYQRWAVDVLRALDDRIDLLRQTNATLESIAQALFKSWFIDFDPVRAKAEGREPEGMDAATAALFPAEFEELALGLIPKGWTVSTLAEHVDAERGLSYKGAGLCAEGEGLPMHNLNSVLEGGGYKYAGLKFYRGDHKERHLVEPGDVIVANTEQGHDHLLIGFPAIVPERYGRALYSHHIYRVRMKPGSPLTRHTLYYLLMAPTVREQIIGCANGSTVNMLKVAGLQIPQFICPQASVASAFEATIAPLRKQMEANVMRAETLAGLRDTLLPRLVSGKLRLPHANEELAEALP